MNETNALFYIMYFMSCVLSFLVGLLIGNNRGKQRGLDTDNGIHQECGDTIASAQGTAESITDRVGDAKSRVENLISAADSITDIISKYENQVGEDTELEQDSAYSVVDDDD